MERWKQKSHPSEEQSLPLLQYAQRLPEQTLPGVISISCPHPLQSNQYFLLLFRNTAAGPIGFFRLHSDARACPAKDRGRQTEQVMEPQSDLEEGEHTMILWFA